MRERPRLRLRRAAERDRELLWRWANDPVTRANSFNPEQISMETHAEWFARKMANPGSRIWIAELSGVPIGQVRYDRAGNAAEVSISLATERRGQGLGSRILKVTAARACKELGVSMLVAHALPDNQASIRAFLQAGYASVGIVQHDGRLAARMERRCAAL